MDRRLKEEIQTLATTASDDLLVFLARTAAEAETYQVIATPELALWSN